MENASKALVMAGGVLISLIIIGALMLMFNNLSSYQDSTDENLKEAQIVEFNNQFVTYDRDDVRGNELYSLLNRVVDYNERKSSVGTIGKELSYEPIEVKISFNGQKGKLEYIENYYNYRNLFEYDEYVVNSNINTFKNSISKDINFIEKDIPTVGTLVLNISTILGDDINALKKYNEITGENIQDINKMRKYDILRYYEFIQFKRAHFNCINVEYNQNTGRVVKMEFKFNGTIE